MEESYTEMPHPEREHCSNRELVAVAAAVTVPLSHEEEEEALTVARCQVD